MNNLKATGRIPESCHNHNHNNHHHLANTQLGHLLTPYSLTRLEVCLTVSPSCICLSSVVLFSIFCNLVWDILFICCNHSLLYSCVFPRTGAIFNSSATGNFWNAYSSLEIKFCLLYEISLPLFVLYRNLSKNLLGLLAYNMAKEHFVLGLKWHMFICVCVTLQLEAPVIMYYHPFQRHWHRKG
jgi:hypothetical protein